MFPIAHIQFWTQKIKGQGHQGKFICGEIVKIQWPYITLVRIFTRLTMAER